MFVSSQILTVHNSQARAGRPHVNRPDAETTNHRIGTYDGD
jgi:hypothetical protein